MIDEYKKVLERIRKLLALAGNNDNSNESAVAAAQAVKLMERHQIMAADVEGGDDEEDVTESYFGPVLKRKSTWQGALALVIAKAFGCATCWSGSRLLIAGRPRDMEAAAMARDYCHHEIDRLTAYFASGRGRAFGVAFRMGCVHAINEAIQKEQAELRREMQDHVSETALVIVDQRAEEAREAFGELKKTKSNLSGNDIAYAGGIASGRAIYQGTKIHVEA